MDRRKFLLATGSLAAGGAAALGTGAFDSAQINDRTAGAQIRVDSASNQLLRLVPTSQHASINGDGKLTVFFDSLAQDAEYSFSDLFAVQNQGGNTIELSASVSGTEIQNAITAAPATNLAGNSVNLLVGSLSLNSGGEASVGADIQTSNGINSFTGEFTISADEP